MKLSTLNLPVLFLVIIGFVSSYTALAANSDSALYEDALAAFNEGNVSEAYVVLKNALQENDEHLPSKILMGRILIIDGYFADAIDEMEEALQLGADKTLVYPALSRAYLFTGQYEKITDLRNDPDNSEAFNLDLTLIAGQAHFRAGQIDDAIKEYELALQNHPSETRLLNALAAIYIQQNKLDLADTLLKRSIEIAPDNAFTLHETGKLHKAKGEYDKALAQYQLAEAILPDAPNILRSMATLYLETGHLDKAEGLIQQIEEQSPFDVHVRLLKARLLALTNKQAESNEILVILSTQLSLLTEQERKQHSHLGLVAGVVAYINKNYDAASTELSRYVNSHKPDAKTLGMLADSLIKTGRHKTALDVLQTHRDISLEDIDVAVLYCDLHIAFNLRQVCMDLLPTLQTSFGKLPSLLLTESKLYFSEGKTRQALQLLQSALPDTQDADVLQMKAVLMATLERYEEAWVYAQKAVEAEPDNIDFKVLQADIALRANTLKEAEQIVNEVLKNAPEHIAALLMRARVLYTKGQTDQSIDTLKSILTLDTNNIHALLLMTQAQVNNEQIPDAIETLLTAKSAHPENREVRLQLISVYRQAGDAKRALFELEQLMEKGSFSPQLAEQKTELLLAQGLTEQARLQLSALYESWQTQPDKLLHLSKLQMQANDTAGAEQSLLRAKKIEQQPKPQLEYIRFLLNQERIKEAQSQTKIYEQQFGVDANIQLLKGEIAAFQQSYEQAFEFYSDALQLAPDYRLAVIKLYTLAEQGIARQNVIAQLEKRLIQRPTLFEQHLLADLFYIDGNFTQAKQLYLTLLESDALTRRAFVLNNLALILVQDDKAQALNFARQAHELVSNHPAILDTLGWVLVKNEQLDEGLSLLRKAYALDVSNPSVHYHLAYTLAQKGRVTEARQTLLANNTLAYDFKEKTAAQALLERLQ